MFGLPEMLMTPEQIAWHKKREEDARKSRIKRRRLFGFSKWDPAKTTFSTELNLKAKTYKVPSLFEVKPTPHMAVNKTAKYKTQHVISPCRKWLYREIQTKKYDELDLYASGKIGSVMFDGPVLIPAIHQRHPDNTWEYAPWMSLAPMEIISLRPGTQRAKGTVVITGLGMGYQLVEICKRKKVEKVILVEIDQGIVDWIFPLLDLNGKDVQVIIGDADVEVPKLTADIAILDHFKSYGGNRYDRDRLADKSPNIKAWWAWGAGDMPDRGRGLW